MKDELLAKLIFSDKTHLSAGVGIVEISERIRDGNSSMFMQWLEKIIDSGTPSEQRMAAIVRGLLLANDHRHHSDAQEAEGN